MKKLFFIFISLLYSFDGYSSPKANSSHPYIGVASSVFLGFGSGPLVQDQKENHSLLYATTQGLGLVLLFTGAGSCHNDCSSSSKNFRLIGVSIFAASRLVEILDSSIFAWKFYKNENSKSTLQLIPAFNGGSVVASLNF